MSGDEVCVLCQHPLSDHYDTIFCLAEDCSCDSDLAGMKHRRAVAASASLWKAHHCAPWFQAVGIDDNGVSDPSLVVYAKTAPPKPLPGEWDCVPLRVVVVGEVVVT